MSKALQDEGGGGRVAITVAMTVARGQCPELLAAAAACDHGVPAQSVTWRWLPLRVSAPNLSWAAGKGLPLRSCGGPGRSGKGVWLDQHKSICTIGDPCFVW